MDAIRTLLKRHARLHYSAEYLPDHASLFEAGLDSFAIVNLMLAIEDDFGVELPDSMLSRETFASVASLRNAVAHLQAAA